MREKTQLSLDLDKPCNHFELRLEDGVARGKHLTGGKITLYSEIWVDGRHIDEPHFIDLPLLVQSLHEQRWFEIFTCGCGVGGCAGIVEGIQVTHHTCLVQWSFRRPQSAGNLLDPALSEWEKTAVPVVLVFERTQMVKAIEDYLDAVRVLVGTDPSRFMWPVHGTSIRYVLNIDPNHPFSEIRGED